MEFREAKESDIPAMARLRGTDLKTEKKWILRISDYMNLNHNPQEALLPRVMYVATEADALIGFIAGHLTRRFQCDGELQWINVEPEYRGTGIASGLLKKLAVWFIDQKALHICVDCAPDNSSAQNFYRFHGAKNLNEFWLVWKDISVVLNR